MRRGERKSQGRVAQAATAHAVAACVAAWAVGCGAPQVADQRRAAAPSARAARQPPERQPRPAPADVRAQEARRLAARCRAVHDLREHDTDPAVVLLDRYRISDAALARHVELWRGREAQVAAWRACLGTAADPPARPDLPRLHVATDGVVAAMRQIAAATSRATAPVSASPVTPTPVWAADPALFGEALPLLGPAVPVAVSALGPAIPLVDRAGRRLGRDQPLVWEIRTPQAPAPWQGLCWRRYGARSWRSGWKQPRVWTWPLLEPIACLRE